MCPRPLLQVQVVEAETAFDAGYRHLLHSLQNLYLDR